MDIIIRSFLLILFLTISNQVIATVHGKTLICDRDTRGYKFNSKNKVEVISINYNELKINSAHHLYKLDGNIIFIQQSLKVLNNPNYSRPIGWIFRKSLDYVSLVNTNGDWSRKFLWSCEITSSKEFDVRIKLKIDKLIMLGGLR